MTVLPIIFLGNLIDVQRSSKTYAFAKEVYIIVVVTSAYRISDKTGKPIKDDVLVTDVNPRTLQGEIRDMYNHKMVILNTTNADQNTPPEIRDWLDLIIQSMQNPDHPKINTQKPAIYRTKEGNEISSLRKLSTLKKADKPLIDEYKKWLCSEEITDELKQETEYSYHIDKLLFALGKTIKLSKSTSS